MTVAEKLKSWLDEIGADGLMYSREDNTKLAWSLVEIKDFCAGIDVTLVPAYRHADGTYHVEPENVEWPCDECGEIYTTCKGSGVCKKVKPYHKYQSWLSRKGEAK